MFRRATQRLSAATFRRAMPYFGGAFAASGFVVLGGSTVALCSSPSHQAAPATPKPTAAASTKPTVDVYHQIEAEVVALIESNPDLGPTLIRLAWHGAGCYDASQPKRGCPNVASMRFEPESKHGANAGLAGARDALEPIKARHPSVSYADLWSLASVVAIKHMGGPAIPWSAGRKDAQSGKECSPDGMLPDATKAGDHIRDVFGRMGFTERQAVALCGAHTVGRCHAEASGFEGPWTIDPYSWRNLFFQSLLNRDWVVDRSDRSKQVQFTDYDNRDLMMLPADIALITDPSLRQWVELYAKDNAAWNTDFSHAYKRLMEFGYAAGTLKPAWP